MNFQDIKTTEELEKWYSEKETILNRHARDYAVPFGNVYHLDIAGYVSEERWHDTLPTEDERNTFMAMQNGVQDEDIIAHKDEFGWISRAANDSVGSGEAPCFMTQGNPGFLDDYELSDIRQLYPELLDKDGDVMWEDPDFKKHGVTIDVEMYDEKHKIELVCDKYQDNGSLYVGAYDITPGSDSYGQLWCDVSVNLNNRRQDEHTVFLDANAMDRNLLYAIKAFGTEPGATGHSGYCSYPALKFNDDVLDQMRTVNEFNEVNTPDDYKLVAVKVGYNFALVPKIETADINLKAFGATVDVDGKRYALNAGKTFEDSRKLDRLLDQFGEHPIKDFKVPERIDVLIIPVQMYWKDDPSNLIETNFSVDDTEGLAIDDRIMFSGYTENQLVDMIGKDAGEDFIVTGVGATQCVATCEKAQAASRSVAAKNALSHEALTHLDTTRDLTNSAPSHEEEK